MAGKIKARKSRRKYSTRLFNAVKKIRSALAKLKRKKIIPKETNVKSALPTAGLRRLVKKHAAVVAGKATTYKLPADLPPKVLRDLRSLGYKTTGKGEERRLIVPTTSYVRQGKVYERPTRSRRGFRVERDRLDLSDIELQVRVAFEKLRPGDELGFEIGDNSGHGGKSYHLYASMESMVKDLMLYQERGFKFTNLVTFRVTKAQKPDYIADASRRVRERVHGTPERQAARRLRRREARARRSGVRNTRGH
jgi:hypothetical protein